MKDNGIKRNQFRLEKRFHKVIINETNANKRINLYSKAYNEIYRFYRKNYPAKKSFGFIPNSVSVYRYLIKSKVGVDYGCGTGISTIEISRYAKFVYGLETEEAIINKKYKDVKKYNNAKFIINSSMDLPFGNETIDFFYSTGVLEHLHPSDGLKHLGEVFRVLKKGGIYILITPNRYFGPSDVSKYFLKRGKEAKGLHLKEYSYGFLYSFLKKIGFRKIYTPIILEHIFIVLKLGKLFKYFITQSEYKIKLERILSKFPKIIAEILRVRGISLIIKK